MHFIETAHAGVITDAPTFADIGVNVLSFLLSTFAIIAILAMAVSGTIYFLAADDKKMMEAAKNSAKYAAMGVVVALGGMVLVRLVGQFFE